MHDFRHTFAVHTLEKQLSDGYDPMVIVPRLAAYLGHKSYRETCWYIHLTVASFPELSQKLDRAFVGIIPVGGETDLCKQLPEYETVMAMYGVGKSTGPHLMAELGDVRRFPHRSSIVAFAGVDPGVVGSGKMQLSSVTTSKRGSPQLRKALFQVVSTYVKCKPENEAVYQFYAKKRDEGKPFFVCTTAAANKFLRIYYARVKECLNAAESATQVEEG